MIRSVIDFKYCVDWRFQNIAIPPYLNTLFYFVLIGCGYDDPNVVYKLGARSGCDKFKGEIGVSKMWPHNDSYMAGINGPASFVDKVTKETIRVTGPDPLDANKFGTWFVVDGETFDRQPNPVRFNKTKHGLYYHGIIPASAFLGHENPETSTTERDSKHLAATARTTTRIGSASACQLASHLKRRTSFTRKQKKMMLLQK